MILPPAEHKLQFQGQRVRASKSKSSHSVHDVECCEGDVKMYFSLSDMEQQYNVQNMDPSRRSFRSSNVASAGPCTQLLEYSRGTRHRGIEGKISCHNIATSLKQCCSVHRYFPRFDVCELSSLIEHWNPTTTHHCRAAMQVCIDCYISPSGVFHLHDDITVLV